MSQSTANRIVKNTFWLYCQMGLTVFVSLYTTRLILAGLGASDFGIYNLVGGAIAMLGFLNAAMASATQRFMSFVEGEGNHEKKVVIYNVSISLHLFIAVLVAAVLTIAGYFFFNGILNIPSERLFASKVVYGCLIISTVLSVTNVPYEAVLNSHENMRYYALVGILESLLKLSAAFACVYSSTDKLILYGILMSIIPMIKLTIQRVYCHRHYNECIYQPHKYFDRSIAKEMFSFAGWNLLTSSSSMITMQGVSILINIFGGVVVNAAHGVANQLAGQLMAFSNTMLKALNPVLVKSRGACDNQQMLKAASTGNKMSFLIYTFFAIPFIIETPYILSLWLKETPEWALLFVRLVLIRQMVSQLSVTLVTCINATGKIRPYSLVESFFWFLVLVVGFAVYKLGAPIYSIYVILIGLAIVRTVVAVIFCMRLCGLNAVDYISHTITPCLIQTSIHIVLLYTMTCLCDMSFFRLIVVLSVSVIVHPLTSYIFVLNSKEKSIVANMVKKLIKKQ